MCVCVEGFCKSQFDVETEGNGDLFLTVLRNPKGVLRDFCSQSHQPSDMLLLALGEFGQCLQMEM